MNYQKIRAAVEQPLLNAYNALSPAVPVFFDNITATPKNATTEYVKVNVTFGVTNESTLTGSVDNARGAVVIYVYTEKGKGPARNQTLITEATDVLETLNTTAKTDSGVFFRFTEVQGPEFYTTDESPHFVSRIDVGYRATVLS